MKLSTVHRWLGLTLCASMLIISATGTLLLWKKEYLWLTIPNARESISDRREVLAEAIEKIVSSYATDQVLSIQVHSEGLALHKVYLPDQHYAWHDQQGNKLQEWSGQQKPEGFLLDLHHRLLLGNKAGVNIAGFSGLLLLLLLALGLILWWPRRKSLRQGLLPHSKTRSAWVRSHANIGAVTILPLLPIVISGIVLIYPIESRQLLFNDNSKTQNQNLVDAFDGAVYSSWQQMIERTLAVYPEAKVRWISPPSIYSEQRVIGLQQSNEFNSTGQTAIYFDPATGKMERNSNALSKPVSERIFNFSYPLHTGKLGLGYRLLMTLLGVWFFCLAFFGLYSYLKRCNR